MDAQLAVAILSTERQWQGGEEQALQLARGLRDRGHRVLAIGIRACPFLQRMQSAQFPIESLTGKAPTPWRCWSLRRALRAARIDVVHFNDAHALTLGGIATVGVPGIVRLAARRASFAIRAPARYQYLCDRVLCVSHDAARQCRLAGIAESHIRVVPDGVDPQRVAGGNRRRGRAALNVGPDDCLVLAIGSLAESKGHRYLIEALARVRTKYDNLIVAIAGAGALHSDLTLLAERLGVGPYVKLLGFRDDIPDLVHACDLFVFPSIQEGLGSTLIDVMIAQRPIVTTNAGGIRDLVYDADGQALARVVHAGRSDELAQAIEEVLTQRAAAAARAVRAREYALAHFTVDHMVEQTLACISELTAPLAVDNATAASGRSGIA